MCEGYTDVIGFATAGVPRAVATCGTALTEDHVKLLSRFAKRIVLAFDADSAGQGAADRFAEWEQRYELEVVVADLPPGSDPGDLAQRDPERLAARWSGWTSGGRGRSGRSRTWPTGSTGCSPPPTCERRGSGAGGGGRRRRAARPPQRARPRRVPDEAGRPLPRRPRAAARAAGAGTRARRARAERARDDDHPSPEVEALDAARAPPRRDARLARRLPVRRRPEPRRVPGAGEAPGRRRTRSSRCARTDPGAPRCSPGWPCPTATPTRPTAPGVLIEEASRRRLRELEAEARVAEDPLTLADPIRTLRSGSSASASATTRDEAAVDLLAVLAAPVSG